MTELYRIFDRQWFQIAVTMLRHQLQSENVFHSIKEMLLFKVDYVDNVCKIHQRAQQCHFNLYYSSLLFPHTDVNLTLT